MGPRIAMMAIAAISCPCVLAVAIFLVDRRRAARRRRLLVQAEPPPPPSPRHCRVDWRSALHELMQDTAQLRVDTPGTRRNWANEDWSKWRPPQPQKSRVASDHSDSELGCSMAHGHHVAMSECGVAWRGSPTPPRLGPTPRTYPHQLSIDHWEDHGETQRGAGRAARSSAIAEATGISAETASRVVSHLIAAIPASCPASGTEPAATSPGARANS
jgi:hypothetical protein